MSLANCLSTVFAVYPLCQIASKEKLPSASYGCVHDCGLHAAGLIPSREVVEFHFSYSISC